MNSDINHSCWVCKEEVHSWQDFCSSTCAQRLIKEHCRLEIIIQNAIRQLENKQSELALDELMLSKIKTKVQ